jgi:predicted transcriptional regulator
MNKEIVSMASRIEVTQQLKSAYSRATKGEKAAILDTFCQSTGLSRSSARRYLTSKTLGKKNIVRIDRRQCRSMKYSAAAKEKLVWLWRVMYMPCGKYLVAERAQWITSLEAHGELVPGQNGCTESVRAELLSMSAATVDRYLNPERARLRLKGISTTHIPHP